MVEYDPYSEAIMTDPYPVYRQLRDEDPAHYLEKYDAWALSRFTDIWDASSDDAFSAARGTTPAQLLTKDQPVTPMLNVMDPPEHTQFRSVIRGCFLPKEVRAVAPVAAKLVDELLDAVADQEEFDAVGDFAARLSVTVACLAIGLPVEDGDFLNELANRFFEREPGSRGMTEGGLAAAGELNEYLEGIVRARRKAPSEGDVLINAYLGAEFDGKPLPERYLKHVSVYVSLDGHVERRGRMLVFKAALDTLEVQ